MFTDSGSQVPQLPATWGGRGLLLGLGPLPCRARWGGEEDKKGSGREGKGTKWAKCGRGPGGGWRRGRRRRGRGARVGAPRAGAGQRVAETRPRPPPVPAVPGARPPKPGPGKADGGADERFPTSERAWSSVSRAARGSRARLSPLAARPAGPARPGRQGLQPGAEGRPGMGGSPRRNPEGGRLAAGGAARGARAHVLRPLTYAWACEWSAAAPGFRGKAAAQSASPRGCSDLRGGSLMLGVPVRLLPDSATSPAQGSRF